MVQVTFLPNNLTIAAEAGCTVLDAMIRAGLHPDAPCGGRGTCGKCRVEIAGQTVLACQTKVTADVVVKLTDGGDVSILETGVGGPIRADGVNEYVAAFDIGTTTLVGFLLSGRTGELLAKAVQTKAVVNALLQNAAKLAVTLQNQKILHTCVISRNGCTHSGRSAADDHKIDLFHLTHPP